MKRETLYKVLVVVSWAVLGIILLDQLLFYADRYFAGRRNSPSALWCVFLLFSRASGALLLLFAAGLLVALAFKRDLGYKKTSFGIISFLLALFVFGASLVFWKIAPAGAQVFLKGFEKWVIKQVDVDSIQLWLQSADEKHWESGHCYGMSPIVKAIPEEFPNFLKDFNPQYLRFEQSKLDGKKIIRFEWGGPLGHWGIVIGDPNMKMPEPGVEKISDSYWEYRRIIGPGVYIYDGG